MASGHFIVAFIVTVSILGQLAESQDTRSHACKNNEECWDIGGSRCAGGRCVCQPGYILHDDGKECIGLVNTPCSEVDSKCVRDAHCIAGFCACRSGFSHGNNTLCYLNNNQKCELNDQNDSNRPAGFKCNTDRNLVCDKRSCQCENLDEMIFNKEQDRCVSKVGYECVQNTNSAGIGRLCTENADCVNNKCVCVRGFKEDKNKYCKSGAEIIGLSVISMLLVAIQLIKNSFE